MRIALISRDVSLERLCRAVLANQPERDSYLLAVSADLPLPSADVYLWDWEERPALGALLFNQAPAGTHLVIASREGAREILDLNPSAVTLLLKPVDPAALECCFNRAAALAVARNDSGDARIGSLRHDRDAILDCLLETAFRLQEHDQERKNFLARAVHDFRTPLTAVNGYCGLLLGGELGPLTTAQHEVLSRTLNSVRRLSRLAAALFQWSRGDHAGFEAQVREADIEECCHQALHEIRHLADEKKIELELDLRAPDEPLYFDSAQIGQLLINLLENSCKFTPRAGYIRVRGFPAFWERRAAPNTKAAALIERRRRVSRRPNAFRMEVADTGMGVKPEHLSAIFEEYTSYGGGGDRSGSGLGLAICKRILAEHDGHIFAESGKQGVTFVFYLPFSRGTEEKRSCAEYLATETVGAGQA